MKKSFILGAVIGSLALVQTAQAREFADIYTECGLGAIIAPNNGAVAAITNVTWDLGTTAISSDISSPDSCNGGSVEVASFILNSQDQIELDLAKGEGQYLQALVGMYDCQSSSELKGAFRSSLSELNGDVAYQSADKVSKADMMYSSFTPVAAELGCKA